MDRRGITIALHWSVAFMVLAMTKGGSGAEVLRWLFVVAGGAWVLMAAVKGLLGKPGPKLQGLARSAYPWMHRAMYAALAFAVVVNALVLVGLLDLIHGWNAVLALLAASMFHAVFHLWRHTALYDGALRMMTPRIWHKYL